MSEKVSGRYKPPGTYDLEDVKARLNVTTREGVHMITRAGRIKIAVDSVTGEELRGRTGTGLGHLWDAESVERERERRRAEYEERLAALNGPPPAVPKPPRARRRRNDNGGTAKDKTA